jgi:hypothetical protein
MPCAYDAVPLLRSLDCRRVLPRRRWRTEVRCDENKCVLLDFSSHATYYVVHGDVADGVLGAVYYR